MVAVLLSNNHRIATYVKSLITGLSILYKDATDDIQILANKLGDVTIVNIYKPYNLNLPSDTSLPTPSNIC